MVTWDEERLKVENEVMGAMVDFLRANGIPYKSDIGYLEFPRPMVPEDKFKNIVKKAEAKLKELGYENYNVFETTIIVDFPEQIKWYKATFSSRTGGAQMRKQAGSGEEHEWYVYAPVHKLVLSGHATETDAREEASRVLREWPEAAPFEVRHRDHPSIVEYAKTHPAWAKREGFAGSSSSSPPGQEIREGDVGTLTKFRVWFTTPIGFERFVDVDAIDEGEAKRLAEKQVPAGSEFRGAFKKQGAASQISGQAEVYPEVREGDVGTLVESITAEDTAGRSRRIPAGMEVKVSTVRVAWIDFITGEVIEGENVFTAPTLEFRGAFRKRGASPTSWRERAPAPHDCPVCGDPVAGGPEEYLNHIKTYHPEEWRRLETDPSYSLGRVVPVAVAGIMRCRWCDAPYAYRENLEIHERGCARRAGY